MRTRQTSLHKGCGRFDRRKEMETKTPDAAGSAPSSFSADHSYPVISSNTLGNDNEKSSTSSWPVARVTLDGSASNHRTHSQNDTKAESMDDTADSQRPYRLDTPSSLTQSTSPDYEEELAQMLMSMMEGSVGEELADAFREGPRLPPITRQSLSELDIHNIVNNVKLRHDINFDRDLSFRPNLDGVRGQEKSRATERYWKALAAELELYTRLFHGAPASRSYDSTHHEALVAHAKRRIPAVFETIKEVLKSLVPDRDHSRVEEHLDVPMLMQEIERGVCDFARLAMWLAQLLKEHCAPMRDSWIDQMVDGVKTGVVSNDTKAIVEGLCVLISILETMKLDVANHQIRNLKPVLIEDTINFEQQYHLDRLVNRRSRVNIDVAEAWYRRASWKYVEQQQMTPALQFEVFTRAVVAQLFNHEGRCNFPETFYLDQDRLRTLKAEIEDLIHMEICLDVFTASLRDLQHDSPVSPALHVQVRNSLTALMGDRLGYGASQWFANSEALSLEILRQATAASGHTPTFNHATLSTANENLLSAFYTSRSTHNPHLENTLLQKVLLCTNRNTKSSLMDLFNYSVPVSNSNTPLPTQLPHFGLNHTSSPCIITAPEVAKWQNIANRISHIIILHWRIWKDIAYIPQETSSSVENSDLQPHSGMLAHSPTQTTEQDTPVVASMHTGDASDTGPDAHVAREMSSQ